jgi:hypothetical protein
VTALTFSVLDVVADRFAASPHLRVRLRAEETTGEVVHAMVLRCQLMIEPQRRPYSETETEGIADIFGGRDRWTQTLKPFLWTHASTVTPGFAGAIEFDLPVACSADLDLVAGKFFAAVSDGEVPLRLLFSGTTFSRGASGFSVEQIPWDLEATHRLPLAAWREVMDHFYPGTGWLRLDRDILSDLLRFKAQRGLTSWDEVATTLLESAGASRTAAESAP